MIRIASILIVLLAAASLGADEEIVHLVQARAVFHPEHPVAYIKYALLNRERLVDKVKQDVPLACVNRRGKIAFIPLDASPRTEDLFLKYL